MRGESVRTFGNPYKLSQSVNLSSLRDPVSGGSVLEKTGFPLRQVKNFSEADLDNLATLNITTAEEFISLNNTADKREKVAQLLEVSLDKLFLLINSAKASLPEDIARKMAEPVDMSQYGLGALKPDIVE